MQGLSHSTRASLRRHPEPSVLVYMFDASAARKQQRARELVAEHLAAGTLVVSTQVLLDAGAWCLG